jgi:hypothetical protein
MDAATVVALVSTGVAAVIAVVVPGMTFRFALRQDAARWLREQRAQLYIDMLTEAQAEQKWIEHTLADKTVQERMMAPYFTDTRLPPLERARLGARGAVYSSQTVNRLFNRLMAEGQQALLNLDGLDPTRCGCGPGCASATSWTNWRRQSAVDSAPTVFLWKLERLRMRQIQEGNVIHKPGMTANSEPVLR